MAKNNIKPKKVIRRRPKQQRIDSKKGLYVVREPGTIYKRFRGIDSEALTKLAPTLIKLAKYDE